MRLLSLPFLLVGIIHLFHVVVRAIDLDAEVQFRFTSDDNGRSSGLKIYAPFSAFSSTHTVSGILTRPPAEANPLLCEEEETPVYRLSTADTIILVPRGNCTFEYKTLRAQRLGATGVLIYNTLESRYDWNETSQRVRYPFPRYDYECDNGGVALVNESLIDPPAYDSELHDPLFQLNSPTNVCHLPRGGSDCASRRCLVVNETGAACCAWDLPVQMSGDGTLTEHPYDMVAIFLTMEQGDTLVEALEQQQQASIHVSISKRFIPRFNPSSFLLWMFATALVGFASWYSAKDFHWADKKLKEQVQLRQEQHQQALASQPQSAPNPSEDGSTAPLEDGSTAPHDLESQEPTPQVETNEATSLPQPPATDQQQEQSLGEEQQQQQQQQTPTPRASNRVSANPNTFELNVWHAALFVIFASALLLLLFYFKFYKAFTVVYGIGASGPMANLLFLPSYKLLSKTVFGTKSMWWDRPITSKLEEVTWLAAMAYASAYAVCAGWIYVAFTHNEPALNTFYWIVQNTMGACLTIIFLSVILLNSIKVATVLLVVVFIYDIFFVFLSPYLFDGDNVMMTVATGGGPAPEDAASLCDRYPDKDSCQHGDPVPMLFAIPRINDYLGGSTLLGLGDVLLPGLLVSFAARLDDAKRIIAKYTDIQVAKAPLKWYQGYFVPLLIAYAVGLLAAFLAVVFMERGQPALLYLVPACLGTMVMVGWHEIGTLWKGPIAIRWADRVVKYTRRVYPDESHHAGTTTMETANESVTPPVQQQQQGPQQAGSSRSV